jgi:hypothetical protein
MIARLVDGRWVVIEQTEHARQAGRLAEAWKASSAPLADALLVATRLHDVGWRAEDAAPRVSPLTRGPLNFTEVHDERHADFYAAGIAEVARTDAYAGYLTSLHATGIYAGRFAWEGLRPIAWDSLGPRGRRFLDEQAAVRLRLAGRIEPGQLEFERVWRDYMLLQVFDYLSLLCCLGFESTGCGPVPAATHGWWRLRVERVSPWAVALDPFPFDGDRLELPVACRWLPAGSFRGNADLRRALMKAEPRSQPLAYVRAGPTGGDA